MMAFLLGSLILAATCVAVVVYAVAVAVSDGWCAARLWEWFAVPLGLPPVTWSTAAGILLILLIPIIAVHRDSLDPDTTAKKIGLFFRPWLALASIMATAHVIRWLAQ